MAFEFTPKKRRKAHRLEELQVAEISFVNRPANPGAKISLLKRDEAAPSRQPKKDTKKMFSTKEDIAEFLKGGVASVAKSKESNLESIVHWMSEHQTAHKAGQVQLAKSLELRCPSVADVDEALNELTASIRKSSEPNYAAYNRALESRAGHELYDLRCALERCGSDGNAYSAEWDRERQATRR